VRCGERALVATTNDSAYALAHALLAAGAQCTVVDSRADSPAMQRARESGITVHAGTRVRRALGRRRVEGALLDGGARLPVDLIAVSGGWTPLIHLYCHARGKPRWDGTRGALLPGTEVPGLRVVGAAAGEAEWGGAPLLPEGEDRVWVDLQHDVTTKDIALAVRENFVAVEHLKRYTTLGMANDQGKTSNVNGLALLAAYTGREIGEVGVTTFRPPFVPVSLATVAGTARGELLAPLRRLPAENTHRAEGAWFRDYGNLLRPAWYGRDESVIVRECHAARHAAVVLDASSLGKLEVIGPDAAALLDFVFYTRMSTLAPGRLRYGLALGESGAIFDDGVVLRVANEHFVVSCSSSHVAAMRAHLEEWREDRFDLARVFVHDATPQWATLAISGPRAKHVLERLALGVPLDDASFPHMSAREGRFAGRAARVARVSFTGERCYEVSVPAGLAEELWRCTRAAGAQPLGVEALGVLRAEKGFIFVGQDTDSETMPHDIGMGQARERRTDAYVGDRSLFTPAAAREGRRQLVGVATFDVPLAVGAHAIAPAGVARSIGFVTSSYPSATLGRPVALALIEDGRRRIGEVLEFEHLGARRQGTIVAPCAYDPDGARLHV
jgi:sarcosine oxidase subunit alpha